ncbi:MAG TPA: SET domain-containing protein-lysine N-methyltransferase [Chitinophagaceae bacterium]|nr:SET domain-containing protein-lysine N-methyltransferase [Chitinophagaceae bacterium]HMZ46664.1 SET domain-containing protein-lysine N-methyltransferase [Chitinophagaceae bacterium]HNE92615.1 SET domain-containing protein-lysine N-methyltransferase [Chitinophagaceae bacterium]HNF30258.1 SET domain-containing protein-lysine N-methyltransferase [Chitinophagaceae bacterium]HNL82580.1 SET domain-containing protein-lysine N-methyltransferase [Chitinophagaceae bacterium]
MILPVLFISESDNKGKGVFTAQIIPSKTTIEISPVIVLNEKERAIVEQTKLYNNIFEWGENNMKAAIGLGFISMYNHNYLANCVYEMDFENETMSVVTVRQIEAGEELFINYNASFNDTKKVWFDAV